MEKIEKNNEQVRWSTCPPIPRGTKPLEHQVAGHVFGRLNGHLKNQLGFLQDDFGCVLKPVQGGLKGLREVRFYDFMKTLHEDESSHEENIKKYIKDECKISSINFSSVILNTETLKHMRTLRSFVPMYHGIWISHEHPGVSYLRLENVTKCFEIPCVMDVKVGCVTYDKFADDDKQQREIAKCPALKDLNFQLIGIKVYSPSCKNYQLLDRYFLRALTPSNILQQGFRAYFVAGSKLGALILEAFLRRLRLIEEWFEEQVTLTFIASSLLFVYDATLFHQWEGVGGNGGNKGGDEDCDKGGYEDGEVDGDEKKGATVGDGCGGGGCEANKDYERMVGMVEKMTEVRMIDFTHVFPGGGMRDVNYLEGLRSLIGYVEALQA